MAIDISAAVTCTRCGKQFGAARGHFHTSYATSYKGVKHLPICKDCVENLFDTYYEQSNDYRLTMKQLCKKFDLYWNESLFEQATAKSTPRTLFATYMAGINTPSFAGRCYDHTLADEGVKWWEETPTVVEEEDVDEEDAIVIPDEIQAFWGSGLEPKKYLLLEERMNYIVKKLKLDRESLDVGTELILKQACGLELDIAEARADGKSVDKLVNALNTLLGSANLKPAQQKQESNDSELANTPMGVWLHRYEQQKPLPDKYNDSRVLKYVFTWMGHVLKMMGKKNAYTELYQNEIDRLRVEKPEYDGDDEDLFMDYLESESDPSDE